MGYVLNSKVAVLNRNPSETHKFHVRCRSYVQIILFKLDSEGRNLLISKHANKIPFKRHPTIICFNLK